MIEQERARLKAARTLLDGTLKLLHEGLEGRWESSSDTVLDAKINISLAAVDLDKALAYLDLCVAHEDLEWITP